MSIKGIKREVESLPSVLDSIKNFHDNLIRPLKNPAQPYQGNLSFAHRQQLNNKLGILKQDLDNLEVAQGINSKLRHQASHLVELKLTAFNGDKQKAKLLKKNLLHDQYLNMQQTIKDIQSFEKQVENLSNTYEEINMILGNLPLEYSISYLDLPHKSHLLSLKKTAHKQKELVHSLGKEFIMMAKPLIVK
jgi:hypothetical protein